MSHGKVLAAYGQLQKRLAVYVGPEAMPNITLDPPRGSDDELSFIRLVAWAYVALFETGRVSLGFLRQLPPWNEPSAALMPNVRSLRTWTSHNLALNKKPDIATMRAATEWFNSNCGVGTPASNVHWQQCFSALCDELTTLLEKAVAACDSFEKQEDRARLVDALKLRLDRNWDAYRFDDYVVKAAAAFGYGGVDEVKFRAYHLDSWRQLVASSKAEDIERNLQLRVEADMLTLMSSALPISSDELIVLLGPIRPVMLASILLILKSSQKDLQLEVLDQLKNLIDAQGASANLVDPMGIGSMRQG